MNKLFTFNQFINEEKELPIAGVVINPTDLTLNVKRTSNFTEFYQKLQDLYDVKFNDNEIKTLHQEYKNIIN